MIKEEITYERNLTGSFLVAPRAENANFEEKIMLKKQIDGMLGVESCFFNNRLQYWYNITGYQSLDMRCQRRKIDYSFVEKLLLRICEQQEKLEWNMISPKSMLFEPDYIFLSITTSEIRFMMYPGHEQTERSGLRELMDYLLIRMDHSRPEDIQRIYQLYELVINESSTIQDIREQLIKARNQKLKMEIEAEQECFEKSEDERTEDGVTQTRFLEKKKILRRSEVIASEIKPSLDEIEEYSWTEEKEENSFFSSVKEKIISWIKEWFHTQFKFEKKEPKKKKDRRRKEVFSMEEYLVMPEGEDESEEDTHQPELTPTVCIRISNDYPKGILRYEGREGYSDIDLNQLLEEGKSVCVGKDFSADIQIHSETVSRIHASICKSANTYYIEDLNSTNGTFLNDELLAFHTKLPLKIDDKVQFADLVYRMT